MNTSERSFIENAEIFSDLNEEELDLLQKIAEEREYKKDDVLFQEGEEGEEVFIIKEGVVEIGKEDQEGDEFTRLSRLSEGEIFGELAVFDGGPRSATARIAVYPEAKLVVFQREDIKQLIEENPQLGVNVLQGIIDKVGKRLRRADEALKALLRSLDYTSL